MKIKILSILFLLIATGCSTLTQSTPILLSPSATPMPSVIIPATSTTVPTVTATVTLVKPSATNAPTNTTLPARTPTPAATTAQSTRIIIANATVSLQAAPTPTTISTVGWKTFTASNIAIDYPSTWSVSQQTNGADFTSPQGQVIRLTFTDTSSFSSSEFRIMNRYCNDSVNAHGFQMQTCLDTINFTHTANVLVKLANNTTRLARLSIQTRADVSTFNAMADSVRAVP